MIEAFIELSIFLISNDPYDYNDNIRTLNKILGILKTNNIITDNAEYKTHKNKKELITSCIIDIEQDFKEYRDEEI